MKKTLSIVCSVIALSALLISCGGSDSLVARVVSGSISGCQINTVKPNNLRVGILAANTDWSKIVEIASVGVNIANADYTITLDQEIEKFDPESDTSSVYDFLIWTPYLGGEVYATKLVVRAYLDMDGDGVYTISGDGAFVGTAEENIFYFTDDYPDKGAQFGYNINSGEGYIQRFTNGNFLVETYGCE